MKSIATFIVLAIAFAILRTFFFLGYSPVPGAISNSFWMVLFSLAVFRLAKPAVPYIPIVVFAATVALPFIYATEKGEEIIGSWGEAATTVIELLWIDPISMVALLTPTALSIMLAIALRQRSQNAA